MELVLSVNWDALAAVGSSVAAVFAGWAILQSARSTRQQARSQDFATLRQFTVDIREAEDRFGALLAPKSSGIFIETTPVNGEQLRAVAVDYFNLLETMATGVNHGLFEKVTAEIVTDRIINDLKIIRSSPVVAKLVRPNMTSATTFKEVRALRKRHLEMLQIERRHSAKWHRRLRSEASSLFHQAVCVASSAYWLLSKDKVAKRKSVSPRLPHVPLAPAASAGKPNLKGRKNGSDRTRQTGHAGGA